MSDTNVSPAPAPPPLHALLTAAALLALYIGLTIAMVAYFASEKAGSDTWEHALLIYNGFTAFAVAAGGVMLGTQIQQANVAAARREATRSQGEAERAKQAVRDALAATEDDRAGHAQIRSMLTKAL